MKVKALVYTLPVLSHAFVIKSYIPRIESSSLSLSERGLTDEKTVASCEDTFDYAQSLNLSQEHKSSLIQLSSLVLEWNDKLNLVSRKENKSKDTILLRHILPSISLSRLFPSGETLNIADIGTGGGFPGLPLAIIHPQHKFSLVDSIKKKVSAVSSMAENLELKNVETINCRAEELKGKTFDICLGRSVASLPKFCSWISNCIKDDGILIYIIGGEVDKDVLKHCTSDTSIDKLLGNDDDDAISEKRALVFEGKDVKRIALETTKKKKKT